MEVPEEGASPSSGISEQASSRRHLHLTRRIGRHTRDGQLAAVHAEVDDELRRVAAGRRADGGDLVGHGMPWQARALWWRRGPVLVHWCWPGPRNGGLVASEHPGGHLMQGESH